MGDIVQSVAGAAGKQGRRYPARRARTRAGSESRAHAGAGRKLRNGIRHGGNDASRGSFERGRVSLQQGHSRSPAPDGGGARSRRARRAERSSLLYAARRLRDGAQGIPSQGDPRRDDGHLHRERCTTTRPSPTFVSASERKRPGFFSRRSRSKGRPSNRTTDLASCRSRSAAFAKPAGNGEERKDAKRSVKSHSHSLCALCPLCDFALKKHSRAVLQLWYSRPLQEVASRQSAPRGVR